MSSRPLVKAIRQGSGKAYFLVRDDLDAAKPILLRFMNETISLDIQSNGTHAEYLYDLLKLYPDQAIFLEELLKTERYSLRSQDLFAHRVGLLGLFARDGHDLAKTRLDEIYRSMKGMIYRFKGDFPFYFLGAFDDLLFAITYDADCFHKCGEELLGLMKKGLLEYEDVDWYLTSCCMDYEKEKGDDPLFQRLYKMCRKDIALIRDSEGAPSRRKTPRAERVSLDGLSEEEVLEVLPLFIKGAKKEDEAIILKYLKKLDYDYRRDAAHPAILAITQNEHLTKKVYRFAYDHSYCSGCRSKIFFLMGERGFLDEQMILEATHDCEEEVAKIAAKILKQAQN